MAENYAYISVNGDDLVRVAIKPGCEHPEEYGHYIVKVNTGYVSYITSIQGTRFGWNTTSTNGGREIDLSNRFHDSEIEWWIDVSEASCVDLKVGS